MDYNRNPDGSYMDKWDILEHMLDSSVTDPETRDLVRRNFEHEPDDAEASAANELGVNLGALERDNFGRWIRNSYGLWREDNPHVVLDAEPNAQGVIDHPLHPDNLSGWIIDMLVVLLNVPPDTEAEAEQGQASVLHIPDVSQEAAESLVERYWRMSKDAAEREENSRADEELDEEIAGGVDGPSVHLHSVRHTTIVVVRGRDGSSPMARWAARAVVAATVVGLVVAWLRVGGLLP